MQPTDFIEENALLKQRNASLEADNSLLRSQCNQIKQEFTEIKQQLDWLRRQVFGRKSEKQILEQPEQGHLFQRQAPEAPTEHSATVVKAHTRRNKQRSDEVIEDIGLRFDGSVPVETVEILPKELTGENAHEFEIIGFDETNKLAMRPGSYVILRQRVAKVRRKADQRFLPMPEVPGRVLDRCVIDVSTLAGIMGEGLLSHAFVSAAPTHARCRHHAEPCKPDQLDPQRH